MLKCCHFVRRQVFCLILDAGPGQLIDGILYRPGDPAYGSVLQGRQTTLFQFNRSNTRRAADRAEHLKLCRGNIQRRQILVKQTIFLLINHMD
ncbi:hypothetical protein HMPREF9349_03827 [Escherichia coli MS 79-10]|nr:hypothetical protein HMPREF9349_03827 [Escherichia coli MS 79-10]